MLEPYPGTFRGDAAAVAAGIRTRCLGAPGQAKWRVRVGERGAYWAA